MEDTIKLSDAITAMQNGLKSLSNEQNNYKNKEFEYRKKAENLNAEIIARRNMLNSMIELQAVLGNEETIKFVIP